MKDPDHFIRFRNKKNMTMPRVVDEYASAFPGKVQVASFPSHLE